LKESTASGLRTSLWEHQCRGFDFAAKRVPYGSLLGMDMGTGKTLTAIALCQEWGAERVLIACPLSVVGTWPRELADHSTWNWRVARCDVKNPLRKSRMTVVEKYERAKRALEVAKIEGRPCAVVVNHESLWRTPFRNLFLEFDFDVMILDECHRAKSPGGKLSIFLHKMVAPRVGARLGLSGTPLPHSIMDGYAQGRFLDARIFGTSYNRMKQNYAVMGGFEARQIVAYKNVPEFEDRFAQLCIRITKAEALDLPDEIDQIRLTGLEDGARKLYEDLETDLVAEIEGGHISASNALVKLLRLQQITSGSATTEDGDLHTVSTAKEELLTEVLEDLAEPAVVFCRFTQDLRRVESVCGQLGLAYGEVSGQRKDLTHDSRMPEDVDVLGAQIQAGGVGIDLTRAAIAIYYSMGFNLGDYLQSRSRLHRPGQDRHVTFLHLLCEGTIDEKVLQVLKVREQVVNKILEGGMLGAGR